MFHPRCLSGLVTHDRKERILSKSSWIKPLQLHATGTPRKIVGYHLDERFDWVAELECGHQQHVRYDPSWNTRHWVTSSQGRLQHIGQNLLCVACLPTI
jgi:Protein of unknown function (DUF3565)